MSLEKLREWVGRTQVVEDFAAPFPVRALTATFDEKDADPRNGDALPPLWHWLYFLDAAPQSKIGPDGAPPARGCRCPAAWGRAAALPSTASRSRSATRSGGPRRSSRWSPRAA